MGVVWNRDGGGGGGGLRKRHESQRVIHVYLKLFWHPNNRSEGHTTEITVTNAVWLG